jgi:hypothetical protein
MTQETGFGNKLPMKPPKIGTFRARCGHPRCGGQSRILAKWRPYLRFSSRLTRSSRTGSVYEIAALFFFATQRDCLQNRHLLPQRPGSSLPDMSTRGRGASLHRRTRTSSPRPPFRLLESELSDDRAGDRFSWSRNSASPRVFPPCQRSLFTESVPPERKRWCFDAGADP